MVAVNRAVIRRFRHYAYVNSQFFCQLFLSRDICYEDDAADEGSVYRFIANGGHNTRRVLR